MTQLINKYKQLRYKASKVGFDYWNNDTSLKYNKSWVIFYKINNITNKLLKYDPTIKK